MSVSIINATMTASQGRECVDTNGYGPIHIFGAENGLFERHLLNDNVIDRTAADSRDRFEAFARAVRDILSERWVATEKAYNRFNPKRISYEPLRAALLTRGDCFMHLADLTSYIEAQQRLGELYRDPRSWARKAILNVAGSGKFSSDRTIAEYASDIWGVKPCPVR